MFEITFTLSLIYCGFLSRIFGVGADNYTNILKPKPIKEVEHVEVFGNLWNTKCNRKISSNLQDLILNFYKVVQTIENKVESIRLVRPHSFLNTNQEIVLQFSLNHIYTTKDILSAEFYVYRLKQMNNTRPSIIRLYEIDPQVHTETKTRKPLAVSYMDNPSDKYEV
ncbi:hypothetical protein RN001_004067 [Aquatica leii]|uniref:Uncharacterized protein n=1 Tax=Aquatica leii TaxID=1421715 RepID=A0AAN7PRT7_9COLE|nr:hypothetical protein RN001_004067 [Aquatica leii]